MLILFWLSQIWPVILRIQQYVFSGCTVLPDSEETELGSSNEAASPSAAINTRIVLVLCCTWNYVPTVISSGVDIYKDKFSVRITKITLRIGVSWTHSLLFWPSLYSCSIKDKFGSINWFCQFFCERLTLFNPKGLYYSYAWPCNLSKRSTSFCMEPIFRKLSGFILRFSNGFTSLMSYFFFSVSITFCVFMHGFWSYLFLHIDEVLSINLSANVFVFGDFNIHHKDWLT